MKTNFSLLFYLKKQKNYINGNAPIYMRITVKGKRSEITSGRDCDPTRWNAKAGRAIGTKEDVKLLNTYLDQLQTLVYGAHQVLSNSGLSITSDAIKNGFLGKAVVSHSLLEVIKDHNLKMKALIGKDYVQGTLNRYTVLERHIGAFIASKYNLPDMDIRQVDQSFINDFDYYLRADRNCSNNYVVKNMKNLGKIIHNCLANNWITLDPFLGYKGKTKNIDRYYINQQEIEQLTDRQFTSERLRQVRDVFLFCCFTGLAYVDVFKLTHTQISQGNDGERWIFTKRQKTKTRSAIPLLPAAIEIIDRYADHPVCINKRILLPVPSNQKMNEYCAPVKVL